MTNITTAVENRTTNSLLSITDLSVHFPTRFGEFVALQNFDMELAAGEIHGLVGESGAGKSTVGAAIIGLLQSPGYIANGDIKLDGQSLNGLSDTDYHAMRGSVISMIFQDPQTSLNPLLRISAQLVETIQQHQNIGDSAALDMAIELLEDTGITNAKERINDFPHQFSGGMRQRVVIALAFCTNPKLIIADEPTTALDVAVQKNILNLILQLAKKRHVGFILITHDVGVIAEIADTVTIMRRGRVMETGSTQSVFSTPSNNYTKSLLAAVPRLDKKIERFIHVADDPTEVVSAAISTSANINPWRVTGANAMYAADWLKISRESDSEQLNTPSYTDNYDNAVPVLELSDVGVVYPGARTGWFSKSPGVAALSNINFSIGKGQVLGVVGESGSGKSTLAKIIAGLIDPTSGHMQFNGQVLPQGSIRSRHHPSRRLIQMIFQDPYSSLNNRRTVEAIISEPIRFHRLISGSGDRRKLIASILELVGMQQSALLKYPHQFSGGQRQRVAVARSLVANPKFLICDEPTSALDVSVQAQILNLLKDLQDDFSLTQVFISHNLAVIRQMADIVVVLRHGEIVETAPADQFFQKPSAEYSQMLLRETPSLANASQ